MEQDTGNIKPSEHDQEVIGSQSRSIKNWHLLTDAEKEEITESLKPDKLQSRDPNKNSENRINLVGLSPTQRDRVLDEYTTLRSQTFTERPTERPQLLLQLPEEDTYTPVNKDPSSHRHVKHHMVLESQKSRKNQIYPTGTIISLKKPGFLLSLGAAAAILFASPKLAIQEKPIYSPIPQKMEQLNQVKGAEPTQNQTNQNIKEATVKQESAEPTSEDYKQAIEEGYKNWGPDMPMAKFASIMAEAPLKYPIFKKYPFLLPAIALKESSGGKPYDPVTKTGVTHKNNPLNWGVKSQISKTYNPKSFEQNIYDAMSGIGGRESESDWQEKYSPTQISTSSKYEAFRKSGDLLDLANTYAPLGDNPETGGLYYVKSLKEIMDVFESKLKKS